jgi:hypothetical protein
VATDSLTKPHRSESDSRSWRDRLGIALSVLCLLHCLLTPLLVGLLPVGVAMGIWHRGFHQVFLVLVPIVALLAFIPGWRRHRDARVWYWASAGMLFLVLGVWGPEFLAHSQGGSHGWTELSLELGLTALGGVCLIRAHLLNRALSSCCDTEQCSNTNHS